MAASPSDQALRKSLGLLGVTINAMALIAPGAFLWITYQVQAAQTDPAGGPTAPDMWFGLVLALGLAFLTAGSYSMLAGLYPGAGSGSSYYYAERAFLDRGGAHAKLARLAKFNVGWISHLYYWVYPGVMVAFMAVLIVFIFGVFGIELGPGEQVAVAVAFALLTGIIAHRGITASTKTNLLINVAQIAMLVGVTVLAITYRLLNPEHVAFVMPTFAGIVSPHDFSHVLFQATIAILLLVGFESATALAAEAKHPRHVSRGVMLSLAIQGLFAYLFEYFGFQAWINNDYTRVVDGKTYVGFAAAAQSGAPMGDMVRNLGNTLLAGHGFELMAVSAAAVAAAILGTTLACLNTGVRITFAMGQDTEMPRHLGRLHPRNSIPHYGVWALTAVSAAIGAFGVLSLRNLTAITFLSNIGTFLLYGLTNVVALVALAKERKRSPLVRIGVPVLGAGANAAMMMAVVWLGILGGGDTQWAASVALVAAGAWVAVGVVYLLANSVSLTLKRPIILRTDGDRPASSAPASPSGGWRPMPIQGMAAEARMVALQCPRCGHSAPMALDDLRAPSLGLQGEEGD